MSPKLISSRLKPAHLPQSHAALPFTSPSKWQAAAMLALGAGVGVSGEAHATGETDKSTQTGQTSLNLPTVRIHGQENDQSNVNNTELEVGRMPGTAHDTPQTIGIVPKNIIEQQRLFSLNQALQNVPGITMSTGEGNGGLNGDQFRIRGQQARGDLYEDGLRDFGVYTHDMFNTENVQVIKGPSGDYFGAGNVGGVVNQTLKKAHLGNRIDLEQTFASGMQYRGTADINYQLGKTTAVRINGMYNKQAVADRDHVRTDRYGTAIDFGTGIGTKTTYHLNYQWLGGRGRPDFGVPMIQTQPGGIYTPITERGLDRDTSYTRDFNRDRSDIHMITSKFSSQITNWLTLSNDTRYSHYHREYWATTPSACAGQCASDFLAGRNPRLSYGAGGGLAYRQDGWGVQNISMARARFNTAFIKHDIRAGVDINNTEDRRVLGNYNRGAANTQTVRNPWYHSNGGVSVSWPSGNHNDAGFRDLGLFVSDKVHLTRRLSLFGTFRWDDYESTYWSTSTAARGKQSQHADRISPSASLTYAITPNTNVYFTFSRSYKPVGTDASSSTTTNPNIPDVASNNRNLKPQRSDLFEVGSKADFFHKRLGTTVAFFQVNQSNSYTYDEAGNLVTGFQDAGTGRRIRGVELSATGKITRNWEIYATYAYMTGSVKKSAQYQGNMAPQVPHNSLSIWSNYDLTSALLRPNQGRLQAGGGVQYSSGYWTNEANTARMPYNFSFNTTVSYEYGPYRARFNANNLTNSRNYASAFATGRAVPQSGRTFMGSLGAAF